jgi:hypothetical protein
LVINGYLVRIEGQVTFTGDADHDFDTSNLSAEAAAVLLIIPSTTTITGDAFMVAHGFRTGWDLKSLDLQYDYATDTLYVGVNCWTICGDCDGDGDPGHASDPDATDYPDLSGTETISVMVWTNPPDTYQPDGTTWSGFRPNVVYGDDAIRQSTVAGQLNLGAFTLTLTCSTPSNPTACDNQIITTLLNVGYNYGISYAILVSLQQ